MVSSQISARGIRNARVLSAMTEIPRHLFVSKEQQKYAYDDNPLSIGHGQTISQPYMVALMTELLELKGDEKTLEIGTGCGYQTAVLARLSKFVYTVERIETLSLAAQAHLEELGINNVLFRVGDGTVGWAEHAPFDGIMVTAGCPVIPETLTDQLADNGKLVIPVGDRFSQTLKRITRSGDSFKSQSFTACRFVDLIGRHGWPE